MNIYLKLFFVIGEMLICKTQVVKFVISLTSLNNKRLWNHSENDENNDIK